jgi:hypothetical protein
VAAVHFLEDGGDAADRDRFDRIAEPLNCREMAVTINWAKVCDLEDLLQGPRAADDLAENRADRVLVQRALVGIDDVLEDFLFSNWRKDFRTVVVFDSADVGRQRGAFAHQF